MDTSHYLLRWNDHLATYADLFLTLREQDEFIDCSFACDDGVVGAHRIVLAGCSPYLRELLKRANNPHPIIFLLDTPRAIVVLLMEFIYRGQVHIPQNRLNQLLILGQSMKITGLTEVVSPGVDLGRDPPVLAPSHSVRRPSTLSLINRRSSPTEMDSDGPITIAPSKSCVTPTHQVESSVLCDNLNTSLEVAVGLTPSTSITADEVITEVHSSHTNSGDEGESAATIENSPSHTNSSEEKNFSASAGEGEGSSTNLPQEKEDVVSHPADPQTMKRQDESGHVDLPTTRSSTTAPVRRKATASDALSDSEKPCPLSKKRKQGEAEPVVIYDRFTHLQHVLRTESPDHKVLPSSPESSVVCIERILPSEERILPSEECVLPSEERVLPSEEHIHTSEEHILPSEEQRLHRPKSPVSCRSTVAADSSEDDFEGFTDPNPPSRRAFLEEFNRAQQRAIGAASPPIKVRQPQP